MEEIFNLPKKHHTNIDIKTELSAKKFKCNFPGCSKQFKGKCNLIIHQRKHVF